MELTEKQQAWLRRHNAGIGPGYWIALGWPDVERGLDMGSYLSWLEDQYEDYKLDCEIDLLPIEPFDTFCEGMKTYEEWREDREDEVGTGAEEFSRSDCDCCGNPLAGSREPATLMGEDPADYVCLSICQDCLMYVANGEIPDDDYLGWVVT